METLHTAYRNENHIFGSACVSVVSIYVTLTFEFQSAWPMSNNELIGFLHRTDRVQIDIVSTNILVIQERIKASQLHVFYP